MFSGIVETTTSLLQVEEGQKSYRIFLKKPAEFDDIKVGDSIAVNGVCLTVEKFDEQQMQFSLGLETIKVLQWKKQGWKDRSLNVERSLKLSDRIHGHLVTGHVEELGKVLRSENIGDNWFLDVQVSKEILPYLWKKGSITLHGVSLTVNELNDDQVQVCLIPETQKRTNLIEMKPGDSIHVEPDYMAKAFYRFYELQGKHDKV
jgi:riboflavin synthase